MLRAGCVIPCVAADPELADEPGAVVDRERGEQRVLALLGSRLLDAALAETSGGCGRPRRPRSRSARRRGSSPRPSPRPARRRTPRPACSPGPRRLRPRGPRSRASGRCPRRRSAPCPRRRTARAAGSSRSSSASQSRSTPRRRSPRTRRPTSRPPVRARGVGNWQLTHGISCAIVRRKNGADAFLTSARRSGVSSATPRVLSGASIVIRASMWSVAKQVDLRQLADELGRRRLGPDARRSARATSSSAAAG